MTEDAKEKRLARMLSSCTADLLCELGAKPQSIDEVRRPRTSGEHIAAFSGFGGNGFRGSYTLLAPSPLLSRLHPLPPTVDPRDLTDWACELVNQSVGRFRNRLLSYGVDMILSVPQSVLAEELRLSSSLQPARSPSVFVIDGMVLEGWLELELNPVFRLPESPLNQEELALKEGSLVLF
jgi:hypothetical protein